MLGVEWMTLTDRASDGPCRVLRPRARSLRSFLGGSGGERAPALLGQAGHCLAQQDDRHTSQHGGWGKAATEAGGQDERDPDPGPGQAAAQRSRDPALDRRQGAQGERHPAAQQPASTGAEGRLAAFQDRAFQTDPGCCQPQVSGQCP